MSGLREKRAAIASAVAAGLSRKDEYQADAYAAALMTKAGFGTGPQTDLLARLIDPRIAASARAA